VGGWMVLRGAAAQLALHPRAADGGRQRWQQAADAAGVAMSAALGDCCSVLSVVVAHRNTPPALSHSRFCTHHGPYQPRLPAWLCFLPICSTVNTLITMRLCAAKGVLPETPC